jgi:glycosyltransferase involved in cell wall biosynthesis
MDVFLNSSHSEGFSLVILEAMACGIATVATAVGEVPEMGTPGRDYVMVPPKDSAALAAAASDLLSDPGRRAGIAAAGLALAGTYTWERATDQFERALARGAA